MTRRILLTLTASVLLVIVAFLIPLWIFVGNFSVDRVQRQAVLQVQPLLSALTRATIAESVPLVTQFSADSGYPTTVYYANGTVVGVQTPVDPAVELARKGGAFFSDVPDGRDLLAPIIGAPGGTAVLRMHVPNSMLEANVTSSRVTLVLLGAGLLMIALIVGFALSRSFLTPLRALSATASRLAEGDLSARVKPEGTTEIRTIAVELNRLANRVNELLIGEREQVADLAHRLRTPATALRLNAEQISDPETRARLTDDVDRLARMVDEVIREARRPVREGVSASCDAVTVAADRANFWSVLAEDTSRRATLILPDTAIRVRTDAADLADAIDALLGNVFSHTDDGTAYAISVSARYGGGAVVTVEDAGQGLESPLALERGHSGTGSTGLGLDIARRTAESSGGTFDVSKSALGGLRVDLNLGPAN